MKINSQGRFVYPVVKQYDSEALKVSPTTKLPTIYDYLDKFKSDTLIIMETYKLNFERTNDRYATSVDFSNGKVNAVTDATSISQNANYTGVKGVGFVKPSNIDLDPVRSYRSYKAKKRKEKVDKIKRAYGYE